MDVLPILAFLLGGFYGLIKGGDLLVVGGVEIARRLGISALAIGLTVIAWGTSAPEVVVSGLAAWQGSGDMSMGNVLGSNVANIGLVLGICALVLPAILTTRLALREVFWLFASIAALWGVCADGGITRVEGGLLLGVFAVYNVHLWLTSRAMGPEDEPVEKVVHTGHPWLLLLIGTILLSVGARLVVEGGVRAASLFDVPRQVVGLTVFAVGTSLPELAAGLTGARRGETDISIGNVVGSNVFNLLIVVGLAALIQPFGAAGDMHPAIGLALERDLPAVLGFSALAVLLPWIGSSEPAKSGVWKGALLVLCYVAYIFTLFVEL